MDVSTLYPATSAASAMPGGRLDAPALAQALRHLLRRQGDHPARWASARFAAAVDERRTAAALDMAPPVALDRSQPAGLGPAAARLATDPEAVAAAIQYLELSAGRDLPPWNEILRTGGAAVPSDLEIGTWFG